MSSRLGPRDFASRSTQQQRGLRYGQELDRQFSTIETLRQMCERTEKIASFSVGCSLGRGAGDALSDIDAVIGVDTNVEARDADALTSVASSLLTMLPEIGVVVDVLHDAPNGREPAIHRLFVQYDDRLQLDLAIVPDSEIRRGDAAPDFVALYQDESRQAPTNTSSSAWDVSDHQLRSWSFLGWRALLDADKYLSRGSLWEAHQRLNEARDCLWRLWAVAQHAAYPWHGLSQVLDHNPHGLPAGIEDTVAGLDQHDLRLALRASVAVLDFCIAAAAERQVFDAPIGMARYVQETLA